jgi:hypothetical protein
VINFVLPSNLKFKCEFEFYQIFERDQIPIHH